jgi:hypothetical protein
MKQFQKYGVAAAVTSIAAGAVAEISKNETGDLAIIPYYTVLDGKNTGMHIINTTNFTQVVKVRLRRGADSKDALDFNLVMSPRDEWTANIGANPNGDGVVVTTNDTTCTVPAFPEGGAVMPPTFAEGAEEGYVEIIGMASPLSEGMTIAVAAEHDDGVPLSCAVVRQNFYRVSANIGNSTVRGVHGSDISSSAVCTAAAASTGGTCDIEDVKEFLATPTGGSVCASGDDYDPACQQATIDLLNLAVYTDTDAGALKVSWMITDSDGGLEVGDNAVMLDDWGQAPMMTNQELLSFGTDGVLDYDPLNFELPNLAYGSWDATRTNLTGFGDATGDIVDGSMLDRFRYDLATDSVMNDWASFDTDSGTVATDWVVTLPGQYTMQNPICDAYEAYGADTKTACAAAYTAAGGGLVGISSAGALDDDELPLYLAGPASTGVDVGGLSNLGAGVTNMVAWDREEMPLVPTVDTPDTDLGFSPGGTAGEVPDADALLREVNVIMFNGASVLGTAADQSEDLGLGFNVMFDADKGWAELVIDPVNTSPSRWVPGSPNTSGNVDPNDNTDSLLDGWGSLNGTMNGGTPVVGFAAWERSFADQAGNYGRAIEHSTTGVRS